MQAASPVVLFLDLFFYSFIFFFVCVNVFVVVCVRLARRTTMRERSGVVLQKGKLREREWLCVRERERVRGAQREGGKKLKL